MNVVFLVLVLVAFVVAAVRQIGWTPPAGAEEPTSPMEQLGLGVVDAAEGSVTLALGLVGVMALFLGLMKVAEAGGLLRVVAKALRPVMVRLFPEVPANHPAMGAMILNLSANVLGLGNAATPFGIRAMQQLDTINPHKGTASNAMVLFLAMNTSSVTLLPTGVIALRAAAGSDDPAGIVPTTLFATICSTAVAITTAKLLQRFWSYPKPAVDEPAAGWAEVHDRPEEQPHQSDDPSQPAADDETSEEVWDTELPDAASEAYPGWVSALVFAVVAALIPLTVVYGKTIAPWIIPGLIVLLLGYGALNRVRVYEVFVEGARDGFQVALRIIPYLVAILVAVGMLRDSGALALLIDPLSQVTRLFGLPGEALPMAILRPLSGSGAYGVLASIIQDPAIGPDSYTGYLVSTFQGSTETTFYVLAVYFGAVQIRRIRHALAAALTADIAGILAAVAIVAYLYG
ncbi:spore maturation protein [Rhodovibrio salinarum]|uniref:Spore maturation protein n=1 Tax=Rhodovibrio salinarum TaxID=1087 RepID=A0A934QF83_9PROT|nr:spore maturation protein [Rhodovibrio salinarum]